MCGRFAQAQTREEYLFTSPMKLIETSHMTQSLLAVTTSRPVPKSCC
jgi:putative SOS response-associated peptidase YedK